MQGSVEMITEFKEFAGITCIVVRDSDTGRVARVEPYDSSCKVPANSKQFLDFANALLEFLFTEYLKKEQTLEELEVE